MKSAKPKKVVSSKRPKTVASSKGKAAVPKVPPVLLEGDVPPAPVVENGPGRRYAGVPGAEGTAEEQYLPEAYGTERMVVTARDPYWVFARWDLTRDQLKKYNGLSVDGHLVLRMYRERVEGTPVNETPVHPESRSWFVNVGQAATLFVGELGYYAKGGDWNAVAVSAATMTPPDSMSEDTTAEFETLPSGLEFTRLVEMVRATVSRHAPLVEAVQHLREKGYGGLPDRVTIGADRWTPEQISALGEVVRRDAARRVWMGSLEITELVRRQFREEISSMGAARFSLPSSWSGGLSSETSLSSPFGGGEAGGARKFWFNVNAELIIYGATEPDAKVTIGGRPIRLRSDGTFSYRFALPDGDFHLPVDATSADKVETRTAALRFGRETAYYGEVGQHPQDSKLKPPSSENVS